MKKIITLIISLITAITNLDFINNNFLKILKEFITTEHLLHNYFIKILK